MLHQAAALPSAADLRPLGTELPLGPASAGNPTCYFDVNISGQKVGRLVFELKANRMPHTARNFMLLANETLGFGYASTKIHRIMPGLFMQGGDVLHGAATSGQGGLSAVGRRGKSFADESFEFGHSGRGVLAMANAGEGHTNQSQYYVAFAAAPWLDAKVLSKSVVFGQLIKGWSVLAAIEAAGSLPSGLPTAPVMIQEAGVLDEGRFPLGYDNKCLYRILGDTARLRPEHDTSLPGLRALTAERTADLEAALRDAEVELEILDRHAKHHGQTLEALDVANGQLWAAAAMDVLMRSDEGQAADAREVERVVNSDALRHWPLLSQKTAALANLRAAAKAVAKPGSTARARAAAIKRVGFAAVDEWLAQKERKEDLSMEQRSDLTGTDEEWRAEEAYRDMLPALEAAADAKREMRVATGACLWASNRQLGASFAAAVAVGDALRSAESFSAAPEQLRQQFAAARAASDAANETARPAQRAFADLLEARVRAEIAKSFAWSKPTVDAAAAKRAQLSLEVLEQETLAETAGFAKAMAAASAEAGAIALAVGRERDDRKQQGGCAETVDPLNYKLGPDLIAAQEDLHAALAALVPHSAVKVIAREAKRQKLSAAAALQLVNRMRNVPMDAVEELLSEALEAAAKLEQEASAELARAKRPKSKWKNAKTKLQAARYIKEIVVADETARPAQRRDAIAEEAMHSDTIRENIERQLEWGRAKHRLYQAWGEAKLLDDLQAAATHMKDFDEVDSDGQLSEAAWHAACDRLRATAALQVADGQTRLDGIALLREQFKNGKARAVASEARLRTRLQAAKGLALLRRKVHHGTSDSYSQEECLLIMAHERAVWMPTLFASLAEMACGRARVKADKALRIRIAGDKLACTHGQRGIVGDIEEEFHGKTALPWGGDVVVTNIDRAEDSMQTVRQHQGALMKRMAASNVWRKHKGVLSWMNQFRALLGDDIKAARARQCRSAENALLDATEDTAEVKIAWSTLADARGVLAALGLAEVASLGRSEALAKSASQMVAEATSRRLHAVEIAASSPTDELRRFKDARQQVAVAAGVCEVGCEFAASRAVLAADGSREERKIRTMVLDASTAVQQCTWDASAMGVLVDSEMARRRAISLREALAAARAVQPVISEASVNRAVAMELIETSGSLAQKTREALGMEDGKEKEQARRELEKEAKALAEVMHNLQEPSTAVHLVEELMAMQRKRDAQHAVSEETAAAHEREAASAMLQLEMLRSESRRAKAAEAHVAVAADSLSKQSKLPPSTVAALREAFAANAVAADAELAKAVSSVNRLRDACHAHLRSGAFRRELAGLHLSAQFFVERTHRLGYGETDDSVEKVGQRASGMVLSSAMRPPKTSYLIPSRQ